MSSSTDAVLGLLLSKTPEGVRWLSQFELDDQATATMLLDSLALVSTSHFENQIIKTIESIAGSSSSVALYAVREPTWEEERQDAKEEEKQEAKEGTPSTDEGKAGALKKKKLVSYFPEKRTQKPQHIIGGIETGSEGRVASIITTLSRRRQGRRYLNHPSITHLKRARCHELVLVDDIIG
ncbi:MAG TPA: hypothetical protein VEU33_14905, partial [Archangium sp.]|nr:hypothetical protein [Archangium sp.]